MYQALLVVHVLVALVVIGLILIQQGKGADAGAAFGAGASGTVFGAKGAASFLTRATAVLATTFFASSLFLGYLVTGGGDAEKNDIMDGPTIEAPIIDLPSVVGTDENGVERSDLPTVDVIPPIGNEAGDVSVPEVVTPVAPDSGDDSVTIEIPEAGGSDSPIMEQGINEPLDSGVQPNE